MWEMMPNSVPERMVMVSGEAITPGQVEDRLKDTMDRLTSPTMDLVIVYPVSGHPPMRLDAGFVELVSYITVSFPADPISDEIMVVCSPVFMSGSLIRCYQRTPKGGQRTALRVRW
jgi:hypothetical protein